MKIHVFGLGYVGNVTALSLASFGHDITGVEVVKEKVKAIEKGKLPIYEPGLEDLLASARKGELQGSFKAVSELNLKDFEEAEGSIICVGTPNLITGEVDLTQIKATLKTIGKALKETNSWHNVIVRSTVPPGTTEEILIPIIEEESQKKAGQDFGLGFYPEFLREGTGLKDFARPSLNILGCLSEKTFEFVKSVFLVDKDLSQVKIRTAEIVKYVNNSFHAMKVAFANEVGTLCRSYGVNSDELMDIFLSDKILNVSEYYLRPGFAFGGACLPKELRAISSLFSAKGLRGQLINSILPSNDEHMLRLVSLIQSQEEKKVGFVGVAFKNDTDDTRESQILKVVSGLLEHPSYKEERQIAVCDRDIVIEKLKKDSVFSNLKFHSSITKLLGEVDIIVLGPYRLSDDDLPALKSFKGLIIDLKWFKLPDDIKEETNYHPFC